MPGYRYATVARREFTARRFQESRCSASPVWGRLGAGLCRSFTAASAGSILGSFLALSKFAFLNRRLMPLLALRFGLLPDLLVVLLGPGIIVACAWPRLSVDSMFAGLWFAWLAPPWFARPAALFRALLVDWVHVTIAVGISFFTGHCWFPSRLGQIFWPALCSGLSRACSQRRCDAPATAGVLPSSAPSMRR